MELKQIQVGHNYTIMAIFMKPIPIHVIGKISIGVFEECWLMMLGNQAKYADIPISQS